MTADAAKAAGLRDPRITTDVKHVEVGPHRQVRLDRLRDAPARAGPGDPAGRGPARRRRVRPDRRLRGLRLPHGLAPGGGRDDRVGRTRAERRAAGRRPSRRRPGGVRRAPGQSRPISAPPRPLRRPSWRSRSARRPRPTAGWSSARATTPSTEASAETLFALSNGFLGIRGTTDEGGPGSAPGAYVAGLFDGTTAGQEDLVVIADWAATEITVGGRASAPVGVAHPRAHPPARPARAPARAHAALRRPRRPHAAAQVRADREPRRPPRRRRPAGAGRRGRPPGQGQGRRRAAHRRGARAAAARRDGRHGQRRRDRRPPQPDARQPRRGRPRARRERLRARLGARRGARRPSEDMCGRAVECDLGRGRGAARRPVRRRPHRARGPAAGAVRRPRRPVGSERRLRRAPRRPPSGMGAGLGAWPMSRSTETRTPRSACGSRRPS